MVNGQTKAKAFDTFLQRNAFYLFLTKRLPKCRMFGNIRIKRKTNVIFYILRQTGERFAIFQTKKSNIVTFLWRNTYRFRQNVSIECLYRISVSFVCIIYLYRIPESYISIGHRYSL